MDTGAVTAGRGAGKRGAEKGSGEGIGQRQRAVHGTPTACAPTPRRARCARRHMERLHVGERRLTQVEDMDVLVDDVAALRRHLGLLRHQALAPARAVQQ